MLVETDAPYLTPTPYRGRPNASYLVPHTVRAMAEVLQTDLEDPVPGDRRQHRDRLRWGLVNHSDASRRRERDLARNSAFEFATGPFVVIVL